MRRRIHASRSKGVRLASILGLSTAVLVVLLAGAAYAGYRYDRSTIARMLPGIHIAGIDVGGMTRAEAERAISWKAAAILDPTVQVKVAGHSFKRAARDLGTRVDVDGAVEEALHVSGSMGWPSRVFHRLFDRPVAHSIDLRVSYDRPTVTRFVTGVALRVRSSPQDASLDFLDGHLAVQEAKPGRALPIKRSATAVLTAVRGQLPAVQLATVSVPPEVTEEDLGMMILVRRSQNRLYLYEGTHLVKSYPVATGQLDLYDTPEGHFAVINKRVNPTWYNPARETWGKDEPAIIPPGPDNPLGTRALDLNAPGIRIHGTPNDESIGHWASHGCIRMHIPDSEELFSIVDVGTPVVIAW
jgi:lipoprotein-anchoring transpeptidase ErfK/SrfK